MAAGNGRIRWQRGILDDSCYDDRHRDGNNHHIQREHVDLRKRHWRLGLVVLDHIVVVLVHGYLNGLGPEAIGASGLDTSDHVGVSAMSEATAISLPRARF